MRTILGVTVMAALKAHRTAKTVSRKPLYYRRGRGCGDTQTATQIATQQSDTKRFKGVQDGMVGWGKPLQTLRFDTIRYSPTRGSYNLKSAGRKAMPVRLRPWASVKPSIYVH